MGIAIYNPLTQTPTTNPAGNNLEVQYNNNGVFGSSSNFQYDFNSNVLLIPYVKTNRLYDVNNAPYIESFGEGMIYIGNNDDETNIGEILISTMDGQIITNPNGSSTILNDGSGNIIANGYCKGANNGFVSTDGSSGIATTITYQKTLTTTGTLTFKSGLLTDST